MGSRSSGRRGDHGEQAVRAGGMGIAVRCKTRGGCTDLDERLEGRDTAAGDVQGNFDTERLEDQIAHLHEPLESLGFARSHRPTHQQNDAQVILVRV